MLFPPAKCSTLSMQVLTGLQNGRLYVASHPYQPDMDAICTVLRGWDSYPELPVGAHQQVTPHRSQACQQP